MIDETQVYVTGVLYNQDAYPDNPHLIFNEIDEAFRTIQGLEYLDLCINRSETRFSDASTREQLLIFMKDVVYRCERFLTDTQSDNLRTALITVLDSISSITYGDVEIRTTREV